MGWNTASKTADISDAFVFQSAYVDEASGIIASFTDSNAGYRVDKYIKNDLSELIYKRQLSFKNMIIDTTNTLVKTATNEYTYTNKTVSGFADIYKSSKPYYHNGFWYHTSLYGGVYRSADGAAWTEKITSWNPVYQYYGNGNNLIGCAINEDYLFYSTDNGATWNQSSLAIPDGCYISSLVYWRGAIRIIFTSSAQGLLKLATISSVDATSYQSIYNGPSVTFEYAVGATVDPITDELYITLRDIPNDDARLLKTSVVPTGSFSMTSVSITRTGSIESKEFILDVYNGKFIHATNESFFVHNGTAPAGSSVPTCSWRFENKFYLKTQHTGVQTIWESTDLTNWTNVTASFTGIPAVSAEWTVGSFTE